MNRQFLLILGAIIIIFGGLLIFNKRETNTATENSNKETVELTQHKKEGSSGVVLIEYGDFQCPSCGQYHSLLQELKKKYAGKVTFQFRHLPLVEIHQNALIASRAAEAAAMQNKFWQMHDILFENQQSWTDNTSPTPLFEDFAKTIGLDVDKFRTDVKSEQVNNIVQADRAEAKRLGYDSTPTFELNGQKIKNPTSIEEFSKLIDEAIKQNNQN